MKKDTNNAQLIAGSIVAAAVIIGISIIIDNTDAERIASYEEIVEQDRQVQSILSTTLPVNESAVSPVTEDDHIRGTIGAPVTIIEYSDLECPFCKRFHATLQELRDTYGDDVAWVYRHFPLLGLHQKAHIEAQASECVAALGGDDAFWTFVDRFFELSPSNDGTDLNVVFPQILKEIGIAQPDFDECIETERVVSQVDSDLNEAGASGGQGTPWSVVIGPDGEMYGVGGARSFEGMSTLIDYLLE